MTNFQDRHDDIGRTTSGFLFTEFAEKGYIYPAIKSTYMEPHEFDAILAQLKLEGYDCSISELNKKWRTIRALSKSLGYLIRVCTVGDKITVLSRKSLRHAEAWFKEHDALIPKDDDTRVSVAYAYIEKDTLTTSNISVTVSKTLVLPELYPGIDIEKLATGFRNAGESVLMLYGPPGTGKTSFIKYFLANHSFRNIIYVKDPEVISRSDFWGHLTSFSYELVLMDDLDINLGPRGKSEDTDFMSQLLSYTDGIFKKHNSNKVLITTNQQIGEVDGALIRAGRCYDFIHLEPLELDYARNLWENFLKHDVKVFDMLFTSKSVTQAELMSESSKYVDKSKRRDYIKKGQKEYSVEQKMADLGITISDRKVSAGF